MDEILELGDDADLLVRPDEWLENHRLQLATKISLLAEEHEAVRRAQLVKRALQQKNQVAVRLIDRNAAGESVDMSIKIMPLQDAIRLLAVDHDRHDTINRQAQFYGWERDGYDLRTTAQLNQMRP